MERLARRADELDPSGFRDPRRLAEAMTDVLVPRGRRDRDALRAKYEVYLEAARRRELRSTSARWIDSFREVAAGALAAAGASDPERTAPLLVAAIDGILFHQLARGAARMPRDEVRDALERLLRSLLG
jgi:hypothetical protein